MLTFASISLSDAFTIEALWVVLCLILIEGLLSVDNALAIAAMASHLPEKQQKFAMHFGYAFAYIFRIVALFLASFIMKTQWLMFLGAAYLVWLMCNHFAEVDQEEHESETEKKYHQNGFFKTVVLIALLDLSLSFDNVVAAVAFAGNNLVLVWVGVTIGLITLRVTSGFCIKLLQRQPWLEHTAFVIVGFVGMLLAFELIWDHYVRKELFIPISIGSWDLGSIVLIDEEQLSADQPVHYHLEKVAKFVGIFLILIGHWSIQSHARVRSLLHPLLVLLNFIAVSIAKIINHFFGLLALPIRMLISRSPRETQA